MCFGKRNVFIATLNLSLYMPTKKQKEPHAFFSKGRILAELTDTLQEQYNQSRIGSLTEHGKIQFSLIEGLYLLEKGKIDIFDGRKHKLNYDEYLRKAQRLEKNFWIRYCVYRDMRNRGYIVKTALKFGADFRVYDRGIKPGEDHAKWVLYPVHETSSLTWYEFAAKNRVAHSTKKRLLIGIVDDEGDCTYYEIRWVRP